ncbi:MAG: lanthionine synthetase [Rhodocyclaceae bacterium]|nr:MAG: lanthionine synthetase [Rhodocyclaceae bacterium]
MLFQTERHEALCGTGWDDSGVLESIRAIVADIEDGQLPEGHWPPHPLDDEGSMPLTGFKSLYLGSAGVLWALWYLHKEGAVGLRLDPLAGIQRADRAYQHEPDTGQVVPSYYLGEVGIRLVHWRLSGSDEVAERLYASIKANVPNPTNEALWAAPGTMVAAWHLWQATQDDRWRALFAENIEQLWRTWLAVPNADYCLWTQDLYGHVVQLLGAGHGFAGNVYPLLSGASILDAARRDELYHRCVATLRATGVFEDGAANWPQGVGVPRPGRTSMLMQWCHGAPGVITSLAAFPKQRSADMEEMLLAAGAATWRAGPLSKGYGLCHGTAGNGYAFLKLYRRTGDPLWLDRARSFAMHAIAQRDSMCQQYGRGRYTLWTGDPGLAVYLWHCLIGVDSIPALDIVD